MRPETTLFYDVDTQHDFIMPDGKLCVPGTERIIPKLAAITELARSLKIKIVASADRHFPGDPELERNGGKYPDHCLDGTPGQRKIAATAPRNPLFIGNREHTDDEIARAVSHLGELVIEKQLFDVFTGNRIAGRLLRTLLPRFTDVVVYGVYTEVCVDHAVEGLLRLHRGVHVVTDAIADISAEGESFRQKWRAQGAELLTLAQLESRLK